MDKVFVLDFGGQYSQLIARRIRELGVYSEMVPYTTTASKLADLNPSGIILSGGPNSIYADDALKCDPAIFDLGIPILGICYGMQLVADHYGANVIPAHKKEYGKAELALTRQSFLFKDCNLQESVWMSHGDSVISLPEIFNVDATTALTPIAAFSSADRQIYALQFHPEVQHTLNGTKILRNFLFEICAASRDWNMEGFIDSSIRKIKETVGESKVLCALSGGVDSFVAATLIYKAIGNQLTCVFVDHGLLRYQEAEAVEQMVDKYVGFNLRVVNAKDHFLKALAGVEDPEMKRKIIGREFINIFEQETAKIGHHRFLGQGTLYTDIIESGTDVAHTIKSHHNVGGLPEKMNMELLEPLKTLFKDEVRKLGEELGIAKEIVWRQPFPGPGLGIRVIGEVTADKLEILRTADYILQSEIKAANLDAEIWQYFAVLTNLRSVGVMGDERTYLYTVGIRAVTSVDGMTADWARIPFDVLEKISNRIINEARDVNRVVYDITSKPPATIEWE